MMTTYLDAIVARHRELAVADDRSLSVLIDRAADTEATRRFARAISATEGLAVIAEVKRRSPSQGDLFADLDPESLARTYADAGA